MKNLFQRIKNYFRGAKDELLKVSWPSRATTIRLTIIVVVCVIVAVIIVAGLDYVLELVIKYIIGS